MSLRPLLFACLIGITGASSAQQRVVPPEPASTAPMAREATPPAQQDRALTEQAEVVVHLIDRGRIGKVWDNASPIAKQVVPRKEFIAAVRAERARLGRVKSRTVVAVTHTVSNGNGSPKGRYASVNFATQFSRKSSPEGEWVSFHLDGDKTWRLAGYVVRATPPHPRASAPTGPDR